MPSRNQAKRFRFKFEGLKARQSIRNVCIGFINFILNFSKVSSRSNIGVLSTTACCFINNQFLLPLPSPWCKYNYSDQ